MKRFCFFFICFVSVNILSAQKFEKGYMLTHSGDTIKGLLAFDEGKLLYKERSATLRKHYKAKKIKSFCIKNDCYVAARGEAYLKNFPERIYDFMKIVIPGNGDSTSMDLLEYTGYDVYGKAQLNYFIRIGPENEIVYRVPRNSTRFKKEMPFFFEQVIPDVAEAIENESKGYENIQEIVYLYNEALQK